MKSDGTPTKLTYDDKLAFWMSGVIIAAVLLVTYTPFSFGALGEVADYPLDKMIRDWNFIATHYAVERADWYAEFFIDALIVSHIVMVAFLLFRVSRRNQPVNFGRKPLARWKVLTGFAGLIIFTSYCVYWYPSPLKLPTEISSMRFRPDGKAVLINMPFIVGMQFWIYGFTLEVLAAIGFLKGRLDEKGLR